MHKIFDRFCRDENGAAMVEYGLLVALIALVVAAGATTLGTDLKTMFSTIGANLPAVPAA
jgi:pilus assembly protein Flp/PilA